MGQNCGSGFGGSSTEGAQQPICDTMARKVLQVSVATLERASCHYTIYGAFALDEQHF